MVALPESVKTSIVGGLTTTAPVGYKFPIVMGKLEVAVLLAIRMLWEMSSTTAAYSVNWLLWRKTDTDWPYANILAATYQERKDVITAGGLVNSYFLSTNGGGIQRHSIADEQHFAYPVVVTRSPKLVIESNGQSSLQFGSILYYVVEKVSQDDLTRLMVKDHA